MSINQPTWSDVKQWLQKSIQASREKNDSLDLNYEETLILRGRIDAFKECLDLEKDKATLRAE